MRVNGFLEELRSEAWAMEPRALTALVEKAAALSVGELASAIRSRAGMPMLGQEEDLFERRGSAAVVKVSGVLMRQKPEWFSWFGIDATETPRVARAIAAAVEDDDVESIVLHVSSPGGQAQGVAEAADAIKAAAKTKNVECVVDSLCASGAYWLASQASSIAANKDAYVGSIGVYQVLVDSSAAAEREGYKVHVVRSGEHKGAGTPGAPITDNQLAATQEVIDAFAAMFTKAVKSGRELDDAESVATGQVWLAKTAKTKGLIDSVESVASALSRLAPEDNEEDPMRPEKNKAQADEPKKDTSELERFAALKKAFPKDLAFAAEQFELGASAAEAKAAYADVLEERLEAESKAKDEAVSALAVEKAKKPIAAPPAGAPVTNSGDPGAASSGQDFVEAARAYAKEKGCSIRSAMSAVAARDPAGHQDWVESRPLVKLNSERRYERSTAPLKR